MELQLKTEIREEFLNEEGIRGLGITFENIEDEGFYLSFSYLSLIPMQEYDRGVQLSKDSATVLHGFLTAILKL